MSAVLPVRIKGTDAAGARFEALAHTLDLTAVGARLGAIRRELKTLDTLTVSYRGRRLEYKVVWSRQLKGTGEYQVGLQAFSNEQEPWGVTLVNGCVKAAAKSTTGTA